MFEHCREPSKFPTSFNFHQKEEHLVISPTKRLVMGEFCNKVAICNNLECNWGMHVSGKLSKCYCASTHQSPGGKNRPEILKFQDGEDERLKK